MKAQPSMFDDVLIIGGGTPNAGEATAKIGGIWAQPNLGLSYLLAARHVIEAGERDRRVNEIALPAAYLQRHALEVALKDLLHTAYSIKRDEDWLARLKIDSDADPSEPREVRFTHDFALLLPIVRDALAAIGFGDVPPEVVKMVERLGAIENFESTRFRYLTLRSGARSFPDAVMLEVGQTQDDLEALFEQVFKYQGFDANPENLTTTLAHEGMALDQAIERVVPAG